MDSGDYAGSIAVPAKLTYPVINSNSIVFISEVAPYLFPHVVLQGKRFCFPKLEAIKSATADIVSNFVLNKIFFKPTT